MQPTQIKWERVALVGLGIAVVFLLAMLAGRGGHKPGPGPSPDVPDAPTDPLVADLQRLYSADSSKQKATYKGKLIQLYKVAAEAALGDPDVTTTDQLYHKLRNTARAWPFRLPDDALHSIRARLASDYKAALGKADHPLTEADRKAAETLFAKFASALSEVQ
jgi:hypothetical protein